jgi:hypothetical protein
MDKVYLTKPSYKTTGNLSDQTMMGIGIGVAIGTEAMTMIIKRKLLPKLVAKTASLFKKGGLKLAYLSIKKSLSSAGIKMSQKLAMLLGKKMGEESATKLAEAAALKASQSAATKGAVTAAKAGATIGKVGNAAMAIFSVTSIVMDILDVAGYGKMKKKKELLDIKLELEKELLEAFNEANLLNPLIVGPLDKFTEEEMTDLLLKKVEFIFNPDNKADDVLIKPVIDQINKDLTSGKIVKEDLNSDTKLQPYIDMVDAEKLADLVKKYVCIDKGGKTVSIPDRELMCSYKDADSCHKSYPWPPTENDTYAEFRSKEYGGSCQVYTPAMRGMCEESDIPYDYDTKICKITKEYCQMKGAEWKKDDSIDDYDCNIPTEQAVAEAIFGTTVVRGLKQVFDPDQLKECNYDIGEVDYGGPELMLSPGIGALGGLIADITPKGKGYFCKSKKCPKKGIMRSNNNKCVDLPNGKTDNGTQPGMWDCNGSDAQNFYIYSGENFIRAQSNHGKCLDVPNGNVKEGQLLQMYDCNFSEGQEFIYNKDTKMFKTKLDPNLCIDSIGDNQKLGLAKCDVNSKSQKLTNGHIQMEPDLIGGLCYNECKPNYTSDQNAICYQNCPKYGEIKVDGKCVDLPNGSISNGTVPQMWDCNNSMAQKFYFNTDTETIKPVGHENKCFDVQSGNMNENTPIQIWDCNGSYAQTFAYDKDKKLFTTIYDPSLALGFDDNNKLRLQKINPNSNKQKLEMGGTRNMGLTCNLESSVADCPDGYTNNGLFCGRGADSYAAYDKWEDRYWTGDCPPGYTNNGTSCTFDIFGRGGGRDDVFYDGWKKCAEADGDGDRNNCEKWGARVYPKCQFLAKKKGYANADKWTNDACCVCSPQSGYRSLSFDEALTCPPANHPNHTHKVGALCYIPCREGYVQTGLSCLRNVSTLGPSSMSCSNPDEHLDKATGRCYSVPPKSFTNMGLFHSFNKSLSGRGSPIPRLHIYPKARKIEFSTANN